MVPTAGDPVGVRLLRNLRRHLVRGVHPRRTEVYTGILQQYVVDFIPTAVLNTCEPIFQLKRGVGLSGKKSWSVVYVLLL